MSGSFSIGPSPHRFPVLAICCAAFVHRIARQHDREHRPSVTSRRLARVRLRGFSGSSISYTLILATLLVAGGATGDRLGRRVFQTGLILFTLGSLLYSVAPSLGWCRNLSVALLTTFRRARSIPPANFSRKLAASAAQPDSGPPPPDGAFFQLSSPSV